MNALHTEGSPSPAQITLSQGSFSYTHRSWADRQKWDLTRETKSSKQQNCSGWKRLLSSLSPTINPALPNPPLNLSPGAPSTNLLNLSRGGDPTTALHSFSNAWPSFGEGIFSYTQSKTPLAQLAAISCHPIARYLGEEPDPPLAPTSPQVVVCCSQPALPALFPPGIFQPLFP